MAELTALHLLLVHRRPGINEAQRGDLVRGLASLRPIDGVLHMGFVDGTGEGSTHHLALFIYLRDAAALERFGTHALYMEYLQRFFLPAVEDFVGVDIAAEGEPVAEYGAAACFCLNFRPNIYDWQVRALLSQLAGATGGGTSLGASVGTALNKRQPFRAGGLIFGSAPGSLSDFALPTVSTEGSEITSDVIAVVGPASPID